MEPRTYVLVIGFCPLAHCDGNRRRKSQLISWRQGEDLLKQLEFLLFKLEVRTVRKVRKEPRKSHKDDWP